MVEISAAMEKDAPGTGLRVISDEYVAQMYSIIEINRSIIPEMAAKNAELADQVRANIFAQLTDSEQDEYTDYLREIANNLNSAADLAEGQIKTAGLKGPVFSTEIRNGPVGSAVQHSMAELLMRNRAGSPEELLRKSLIVSAISSFEVLFGQIARAIYAVNSSALNDSEYSFTLQELAKFSTLDDAREYLIERRISALLRDSVDGWDKWLKRSSGGLSMDSLPVDWPLIREAFARRNLIVHTGGVVNHLYISVLQKLGFPDISKIPVGSRLAVDEEYLDSVLQELLGLGRVLACAIGSKLYKDREGEFTSSAYSSIQDLAVKRAWGSCSVICEYLLSRDLPRQREMQVRVRFWLSRKEMDGVDSIRDEVERWDTSGLTKGISHCKAVLLGDLNSAISDISELLKRGELNRFELAIDPLYDGVVDNLPSSR